MSALREAITAVLETELFDGLGTGSRTDEAVEVVLAAVERVPVVPRIEGNGSIDGVTPILFFEAGSAATHELRSALTWANVNQVRITIDDGLLKWKVGEGTWCPGYPTERENGGNG